MNKTIKLRHHLFKKVKQKSFHYAYEQGYFDATIEYDLGTNKYKVAKDTKKENNK